MDKLNILAYTAENNSKQKYGLKIVIITVLTSIFACLSGWALAQVFLSSEYLFFNRLILFLILLIFFLVFFILETLFSRLLRFGSLVIETFIFAATFYLTRNAMKITPMSLVWTLTVWVVVASCFWGGAFIIRKKTNDLIKIKWNEITKRGLILLLIGINLFICLQWLGGVIVDVDKLFSKKSIDLILKPSTPILKNYFYGFSSNSNYCFFIHFLL